MTLLKSTIARTVFLALLATVGLASTASAAPTATSTFRIFVDLNPSAHTGCTVTTSLGSVLAGIDEVVTITFQYTPSPTFTTVTRQVCSAGILTLAGTPPLAFGPTSGVNGSTAIETSLPLAALPSEPVQLYFDSLYNDGGSDPRNRDELLTLNGSGSGPAILVLGGALPIPTLGEWGLLALTLLLTASGLLVIRRRDGNRRRAVAGLLLMVLALGTGVAWAAGIAVDGNTSDWSSTNSTEATDVQPPDANPNADIVAGFGAIQGSTLFLRLDARFSSTPSSNHAPVVTPATFSVLENSANGTLVGTPVAFTDVDPGQNHTFAITGGNLGGAFAIDGAGQITVANSAALDFEVTPTFNLTVQVTDDGTPVQSGTGTITVSLTDVNEAPAVTPATFAVTEGAPNGSNVGTPVAFTDPDAGQTHTFAITAGNTGNAFAINPATGQITVADTTQLSFATTPTYSLTVQVTDDGTPVLSGSGTITINVTPVNHAPSFTKGADQTVLEDAGAQTVANWATAISAGPANESGQNLTFNVTGNTNAALFSVAPAISPAGTLTYTPAPDANGTATITVTLMDDGGTANGGQDTSAPQTFVINVTAVNDAPSFTKGPDQNVLENAGAQTVANWATAISAGPADESSQTLTFNVTGNTNAALFSVAPAISPTGTLTYTPAANVSGTATITVVLMDNGGTANGGVDTSAPQTFVINVALVNHAPSFTKGADQTVLEDAGAQTVSPWATAISPGPANEAGQTVTFQVTNNTNVPLFAVAPAVSPTGVLTYTPAANANGTATITLVLKDDGGTANGGVDTSAAQTFVINVTAVNDAPSFTKGADQTVLENAGAQTVSPWATAISPGPADESAQTVTFQVTGNTNAALFSVAPTVSPTGVLTYTPATNTFGSATITLVLKDNGGTANGGVDTSAAQTFTITVQNVNQPPSFTKGPDVTVLEDSGPHTSNPWATAISAGPGEGAQTVSFLVTGDTNAALFSVAPAVSSAGVLTFTPAANANGTATITLVAKDNGGTANGGVDTSAPQTFVINVTAVNDAPSFTKGADQSVLENAGAQTVPGWATAISAGPADEGGQTLAFQITGNTNPALFSVAPAVSSGGVLTYTPAVNAFGSATITLVLMDNGGTANGGADTSAPQTFTITVQNVNQAPSFTKGPDVTVLEDSGPHTSNPWATAISPGPGEGTQTVTFQVTGNTNGTLFSVLPAVSPTGVLTFTPAANANGTATITIRLMDNGGTANGGVDTSATQSFVINVTAVNDAPSFTKGPDQTVLENAGAQTVNPWATAISAGPADEGGQTLAFQITGNTNAALFAVAPAVSPTGVLTYTPAANASGTATITLVLKDNGGTANGGVDTSAAQSFVIDVTAVNQPPSFTKGPDQTVSENTGAHTVNPWATAISPGPANESGQTVTFNVIGDTNASLFSVAPAVSPAGVLTYTLAPNVFGTAMITLVAMDNGGTANGGVDTSASQTFTIDVTQVNQAPSFTKGPDVTVLEDAGPQTISPWATAISPGPASESSQTVVFNITGDTNPGLFSVAPAVSPTGVLTFTPAANANGSATITLVLMDNGGTANGGTDTSASQSFTINVTAVNDQPSFTKGADQSAFDNAGAQTVNPWATAISAGPANESGQTLTFQVTGNTDPSIFAAGPSVSPTGVLTYTPAIVPAGTHSSTITLVLKDNGGTANGGVDTSVAQTFTISITHVNIPPALTTNPISYTTPGNTQLHVAGAILPGVASWSDAQGIGAKAQPTDSDGPGTLAIVAASGTTANGGTYAIATDGSFTYVPAAGFTGADSFTYQVTDTQDTTTGTINITVGARVWYIRDVVDANNAAGGDGRSTNAFDSIAAFNAATTNAGDIIYVFAGNTATTPLSGSITLKDSQKLWGQGIALNVPGFATPLVAATTQPRIRSTAASTPAVSVPATAGNRNFVEVRGLDLETTGATSNAIDVIASGANTVGVTISDDNVRGATGKGVNLSEGGSGAFTATLNNDTLAATGNAFDASTTAAAGTLTISFSNNAVVSNATGININGAAGGTTWITGFANNAVSGNNVGTGIAITSAKFDATAGGAYQTVSGGTTVIGASGVGNGVGASGMVLSSVSGDLAFTDLDIFADGGAALRVTGTGAVNTGAGTGTRVTVGAGVATFSAVGGPAVDVTNATVDLQLATISSTNSASTGVSLDTVAGTFAAGSGSTISNATGTDFNVNAGNPTVTYGGTMTDTTGRLVAVTSTTGGAESFTGAISDTNSGTGQGIFLNANTGATIGFTGTLTLSTGANPAFTATGGGTVTSTDTSSTVTTTTGTALNVANTTIGAAGLKFKSISAGTAASGPANGIILNTTGALGGLTVSGTGAASSGGTIQHTTGAGISLTSTKGPSFNNVKIQTTGMSGVSGKTVTDFTFTNGQIDGSGTAAAPVDDRSNIGFGFQSAGTENNLSGVVTITGNTLTNAFEHGIDIQNFAGTISNATITGNTLTSSTSSATSLGSGIRLLGFGSASASSNITTATISNNTITNFPGGSGITAQYGNTAGAGGSWGTPNSAGNLILIQNNQIHGASAVNPMGANAVLATLFGSGQAAWKIDTNNISNTAGTEIGVNVEGANPVATCDVTNNVIAGIVSVGAQAISYGATFNTLSSDAPQLSGRITGNTVTGQDGNGLIVLAGSNSNASVSATITGNSFTAPNCAGCNRFGVLLDSGSAAASVAGVHPSLCVKVSGNTAAGSGVDSGIGLTQRRSDYVFNIQGLVGTTAAAAASFVDSQNPSGGGPTIVVAGSVFGSCTAP